MYLVCLQSQWEQLKTDQASGRTPASRFSMLIKMLTISPLTIKRRFSCVCLTFKYSIAIYKLLPLTLPQFIWFSSSLEKSLRTIHLLPFQIKKLQSNLTPQILRISEFQTLISFHPSKAPGRKPATSAHSPWSRVLAWYHEAEKISPCSQIFT